MIKHFTNYNGEYRSDGANMFLHALYLKHNGDVKSPIFRNELNAACVWIEEYVRNIYEIIDREIPLMAYNNVLVNGHSGYHVWEEYPSKQSALNAIEDEYKEILKMYH